MPERKYRSGNAGAETPERKYRSGNAGAKTPQQKYRSRNTAAELRGTGYKACRAQPQWRQHKEHGSMGQKLFGRIKDRMHRVKGREPQEGDKFSFRMARFIIHKKGWIESVFVAGGVFSP